MNVKLLLTKANGEVKEITVNSGTSKIGRSSACDIRIPLESCSRQHCQIDLDGDSLILEDLDSSNGTFVNNERVESAELIAGDRVSIGPVVMTVQIDGVPSDATTSPLVAETADAGEELFAEDDALEFGDDDSFEEAEALFVDDEEVSYSNDEPTDLEELEKLANEDDFAIGQEEPIEQFEEVEEFEEIDEIGTVDEVEETAGVDELGDFEEVEEIAEQPIAEEPIDELDDFSLDTEEGLEEIPGEVAVEEEVFEEETVEELGDDEDPFAALESNNNALGDDEDPFAALESNDEPSDEDPFAALEAGGGQEVDEDFDPFAALSDNKSNDDIDPFDALDNMGGNQNC